MRSLFLCLFFAAFGVATAQSVGIGTNNPHPSAALDVQSSKGAFYPPRMTSLQRKGITNAQPGALVYDTDKHALYLYDGQTWMPLSTGDPNLPSFVQRTASEGSSYDLFGASVALSGDFALIGAPNKTVGAYSERGGAYVFQRVNGTWVEQAQLNPSASASSQHFGSSVAIAGDYALIGQSGGVTATAYFYQRLGSLWFEKTTWTIPGSFVTVALSANHAALACRSGGKVYIYQKDPNTGWGLQTSLPISRADAADNYSLVLAMTDDDIIAGCSYATVVSGNYTIYDAGSAYVFHRSRTGWSQQATLFPQGAIPTNLGPQDSDMFGSAVAIEGDVAVVAAERRSELSKGRYVGGVFIFRRSATTWTQEAELHASVDNTETETTGFGASVAIANGYVLAGAPSKKVGNNAGQGTAYLYKANSVGTWLLQSILTDNSPAQSYFGKSGALSDGTYVIGAPGYLVNKGKVVFGTINQ